MNQNFKTIIMNKIKDYVSNINRSIKKLDPEEENPTFNDILQDLKGIEEAERVRANKQAMLISELNELNN